MTLKRIYNTLVTMSDLEQYERECLQREAEDLRIEAEEEYRKSLPKALMDKILELSRAQGQLNYLLELARDRSLGNAPESTEKTIREVLDRVTQARNFIQNNYQQLKTY